MRNLNAKMNDWDRRNEASFSFTLGHTLISLLALLFGVTELEIR
jgi:hypothetical protein